MLTSLDNHKTAHQIEAFSSPFNLYLYLPSASMLHHSCSTAKSIKTCNRHPKACLWLQGMGCLYQVKHRLDINSKLLCWIDIQCRSEVLFYLGCSLSSAQKASITKVLRQCSIFRTSQYFLRHCSILKVNVKLCQSITITSVIILTISQDLSTWVHSYI